MADKTHEELQLAIVNAKTEEEKNAAIKEHNDAAAKQLGGKSNKPTKVVSPITEETKKEEPAETPKVEAEPAPEIKLDGNNA